MLQVIGHTCTPASEVSGEFSDVFKVLVITSTHDDYFRNCALSVASKIQFKNTHAKVECPAKIETKNQIGF